MKGESQLTTGTDWAVEFLGSQPKWRMELLGRGPPQGVMELSPGHWHCSGLLKDCTSVKKFFEKLQYELYL